jgi:hypothetical protein
VPKGDTNSAPDHANDDVGDTGVPAVELELRQLDRECDKRHRGGYPEQVSAVTRSKREPQNGEGQELFNDRIGEALKVLRTECRNQKCCRHEQD